MNFKDAVNKIKIRCIAEGKHAQIPVMIAKARKLLDAKQAAVDSKDADLAYLTGNDRAGYIHDMKIAQNWANMNRATIANRIIVSMAWSINGYFSTVHNYLGDDNIIRKSAVSAKAGEKILIPLNMKDGSIIAVGRGNDDWNCSAPHGAGRIMSRSQAMKSLSLDDFKDSMKGIFTTSVCQATLDECAKAYKPSQKIIDAIGDTCEIVKIIKPEYNFKAGDGKE